MVLLVIFANFFIINNKQILDQVKNTENIDYQGEYTLVQIDKITQKLLDLGLNNHTIVTFKGDLGAGKTTLIKTLCQKLGVEDNISSPTFSIINEYKAKNRAIYHIDLYRIETIEEAIDIGIEEYLYSGGLCLIEWPKIIESLLPEKYLHIEIDNLGKFTRALRMYTLT